MNGHLGMTIGRLDRKLPPGHFPPGHPYPVWHAAYYGERVLRRHLWGMPEHMQPPPRTVRGILPLCGANMMTAKKGMDEVTWGKPTCRRCRKKLGL